MSTKGIFCLKDCVAERASKYKDELATCLKAIDYDLPFSVTRAKNAQLLQLGILLEKIMELSNAYQKMSTNKPLKEKTLKQYEERFISRLQGTNLEDLVKKAQGIKFMHIDELLLKMVAAKHTHEKDDFAKSLDRYKATLAALYEDHLNLDIPFLLAKAKKANLIKLVELLEKFLKLVNIHWEISTLDKTMKEYEYKLIAHLDAIDSKDLAKKTGCNVIDELLMMMVAIKNEDDVPEKCKSEIYLLKTYLMRSANLELAFSEAETQHVELSELLGITIKLAKVCLEVSSLDRYLKDYEDELVAHLQVTDLIDLAAKASEIRFIDIDKLLTEIATAKRTWKGESMNKYRNKLAVCVKGIDFNTTLVKEARMTQPAELSVLLERIWRLANAYRKLSTEQEYGKKKLREYEDQLVADLKGIDLNDLAVKARELGDASVDVALSEIADIKHTHEMGEVTETMTKLREELPAYLKAVDLDLFTKAKKAGLKHIVILLEKMIEVINAYKLSSENPRKESTLKKCEDELILHLYRTNIEQLATAATKIKCMNADKLLYKMAEAKHTHEVDDVEESLVKYKAELKDCLVDFDFDLQLTVTKAKHAQLVQLSELLEKMMQLVNAYQKMSTKEPLDRKTLKEYEDNLIAHIQVADLDNLVIKARGIRFMNVDELLSRILRTKHSYEDDCEKIFPFAMKALKCYEKELIANIIENASFLQSLVQDAHTARLIPEKVKTILSSTCSSVPPSLICRYLILHVYRRINDHDSFDIWLSLLSKCERVDSVLGQVKLYCERKASLDTNRVNGLTAEEKTASHFEDFCFKDEHVSNLTDILAAHSSYWRQIAISLGLPHNEISSIESMMHVYKVIGCLNEVLHIWVMHKYDYVKPPTLNNLRNALCSEIVGLGVEATIIEEKLINRGIVSLGGRSSVQRALSMEDEEVFKILGQSQDTTVFEDKQALLFEVKVSSSLEDSLAYQWYKDGEKLDDSMRDCKCYGAKESIISIFIDIPTVEGSYTCEIQQGAGVTVSEPIVLTMETPLDQYREKLEDFYTAKPEVPEDTWPPVSIDTYINLALIKQQGIDNAGEYARCTIRGDADDVFKDKEKIEYESVFDRLGSGARLLIEGRPGSGKTTLVHKVSKDWAKDSLKFDQVRLLFLVHLRGFLSDPNIKLHNILECYYNSETSPALKDILKYADKHNGLGLCFILDGLDEYLPKKKDTFIHKLIKRLELPKAVVIVASRPVAAADFRPIATRQIEVLGFLKEQISEYIKEYNFSDESKCSELLKYLDHHPNVHHMCYLPIHAAMVCFLCQIGRSLPETETGIYKEFTICFSLRTLRKLNEEEDIYIDSIQALPSSERESYLKICKLAFETTVSSKQVMNEKEVKNYFDVHSNRDYLGLINVDKVALKHGFQKLYTFLHLTFQEFLAACHISNLEEDEQTKLINEYGNAKQMQVVWKFYCGLVKFGNHIKFDSLLDKTQYGMLYRVQCSFESQQPNTCDSIIEDGSLSFKDNFFTPSDFTAIAFAISHAAHISKLVFDECTLRQEGIDILEEKAGDKLSLVTSLCFHGHNCVPEQLKFVNKLIHILPSLEILDITNTQLGEEAVRALTSDLTHSNLQVLKIDVTESNPLYFSDNLPQTLIESFMSKCSNFINVCFPDYSKKNLSALLSLPNYLCSVDNLSDINMSFHLLHSVEVKILSDDLRMSSVCSRLSLINCGITDEGAKTLSGGIKCSKIEILELNLNLVSNEGALALSHSIKSCLSLHTLNLSCNLIDDDGALAITAGIPRTVFKDFKLFLWNNKITKCGADALLKIKSNVILDSLDIESRDIGDLGAVAVSSYIKNYQEEIQTSTDTLEQDFRSLHQLNLSGNSISNEGVTKIADSLRNCTSLTSLNLSSNSFGVNGVQALADALESCTGIASLNLACNSMDDDSVIILSDSSLKYFKNLAFLNLSSNSIGSNGAKALADALKNCTHLTSLNLSSNLMGDVGVVELADNPLRNSMYLTSLDLSRNSIGSYGTEALAGALNSCTCLKSLDLSSNSIGDDGTKALAGALKSHTNLLSLNISKNNIGRSSSSALADIIKNCSKMHTLKIGHNDTGDAGIKTLSKHLKKCSDLHTLSLGQTYIGRNGTKSLAKALKNCTTLCTIDIHDTCICGDGVKAIASVLKSCGNLHTLDIAKNGKDSTLALSDAIKSCGSLCKLNVSGNNLGRDGSQALTSAISHCSNLHFLDISHNCIGRDGAKSLASVFKHCTNLHTLDISHNQIGKDGMNTLAVTLKLCSQLRSLNVSYNEIGAEGAKELADALIGCCSNLNTLNIGHNDIGNTGTQSLADAIKHCSNLHTLDISSNKISRDGARALGAAIGCFSQLHTLVINNNALEYYISTICRALKYCSNLHSLDISHNSISRDGVEDLTDVMRCCSKLHHLNISHNAIEKNDAKAIADVIKFCTSLTTLDFGYNPIGISGVDALRAASKDCRNLDINTRQTT